MSHVDSSFEKAMVKLLNVNYLQGGDTYLEHYQRIDMYIYDENVLSNILEECKYKDVGNVYEYDDILPQPETIRSYDIPSDFNLFQRIAVSKKFNSIMFFTSSDHTIYCCFLVDVKKLKKFTGKTKNILKRDSGVNIFRDTDFTCNEKEYIEISGDQEDGERTTRKVDVFKKIVINEHLVFDSGSVLSQVMDDINTFFKKETMKLYTKLDLPYKRGIILYGDPGNGKSAMIREIIRVIPNIIKVNINPNIENVTRILQSLVKALGGKQAIVIIEDIDSLITDRNRSEFLNILDGVDIKSGIYFIGTTNYPERIDPAFMNRSGRFDRAYKIDNPNEVTRKIFFESRKIGKLLAEYKVFKDSKKPDTDEGVISLFVKYSDNLPMASLKELITTTSYMLASNTELSVEEAVSSAYNMLTNSRNEHSEMHTKFINRRRPMRDAEYGDY